MTSSKFWPKYLTHKGTWGFLYFRNLLYSVENNCKKNYLQDSHQFNLTKCNQVRINFPMFIKNYYKNFWQRSNQIGLLTVYEINLRGNKRFKKKKNPKMSAQYKQEYNKCVWLQLPRTHRKRAGHSQPLDSWLVKLDDASRDDLIRDYLDPIQLPMIEIDSIGFLAILAKF